VKARELHGTMPWVCYRGMTDEDLKSMCVPGGVRFRR
jgi:hypothetical protein